MEEEEYEHIPWSNLLTQQDDRRTRMLLLGVAIAAAAVLGYFGARYFISPTSGTTVTLPPGSTIASTVAESEAAVAVTTVPIPSSPTTIPGLYSEADLMALAPDAAEAAVRMRAEWFVTDFFTVDGAAGAAEDVRQSFVSDVQLPPLPHEDAAGKGVSYVEWARAFHVEPTGPGRYGVRVAFRTLVLEEDGSFSRRPVLAVEVPVGVSAGGATAVTDLPSPIAPPPKASLSADLPAEGEPPAAVISAVLTAASGFAANPRVVGSQGDAERWRVVVELGDEEGLAWPMSFRSDGG